MKFVKKNARTRELALIEQSYDAAIKRFPGLIDGMNSVRNLTNLSSNVPPIPANLNERFTILYTTPPVPELEFLPLASDFATTSTVNGKFYTAITQKALTHFCNYFQYLYMKSIAIDTTGDLTPCSVGRIPTYLPALNSNIGNDTLLSLLKYSDRAQTVYHGPISPDNLLPNADYLKTLYATQSDDEALYAICGPVYFDYTWIFKQNPALMQHILGVETVPDSASKSNQWTTREDPLTENKHYVNYGPQKDPNYPKMRFDTNPDRTPLPGNVTEFYVSPAQAMAELNNMAANVDAAARVTAAAAAAAADIFGEWNTDTAAAENQPKEFYDWTTPGYYRYEVNRAVEITGMSRTQITNRFTQLMRPVGNNGGIQDYTEPNLPTAYSPPLSFITPEMRGPSNSFMIHACIPDLSSESSPSYAKFMSTGSNGKPSVNKSAYMDHMYKMMQLIFKTAILNAKNNTASNGSSSSSSASRYDPYGYGSNAYASGAYASGASKKICIKIMAIGYNGADRSMKALTDPADKTFAGDAFFNALRDYSMLFESQNVHVTVYYDPASQSEVKQRYDEYTSQRESFLLRSKAITTTTTATSMDATIKLKINPMDDFFTLKYPGAGANQLKGGDLLYFVDYCSTPRAFIGNCGEWPENIEDIMDQAINVPASLNQPLLACLTTAFKSIQTLYAQRSINEKLLIVLTSLNLWNNQDEPKQLVDKYTALKNQFLQYNANATIFEAYNANDKPRNINVSWWKSHSALPCNAYMSSFDEHVLILHNLLSNTNAVDAAAAAVEWDLSPRFVYSSVHQNCPYITGPPHSTFENAVYVCTQAKKILTLLSKMGSDGIQIKSEDQQLVTDALAALTTVNMSWSMDAKFTSAVGDGAFIPNSSALHNPFICTKLLDPKEWQFVDFEDVAVRAVNGANPLPPNLKTIVDNKIKGLLGNGSGYNSTRQDGSDYSSSVVMISKQPNVGWLKQNVEVILENLLRKNAPIQYDGKKMVLNNYSWPAQQLYYKLRNDRMQTPQYTSSNRFGSNGSLNFAELMGLTQTSGKCVSFPLFVIKLMFYLFEGTVSDLTAMNTARLSCALDGNMFKTNVQILWEQMMKNMQAHQQNFTMTNLLNRLGMTADKQSYSYTSYFDDDSGGGGGDGGDDDDDDDSGGGDEAAAAIEQQQQADAAVDGGDDDDDGAKPKHSATILIKFTNAATNPTLKTTNSDKLKRINEQI